jgi:proline iminopeptidase
MPVKKDASTVSISLTLADFEAVREKLGIARWHALGFSYGGFLASAYAERYPESVKSLALLGSTGVDQSYSGHFGDNVMSRLGPHDLEAYGFWSDAKRIERDTRRAYTEIVRAMMPGYFYDRAKALEVSQAIEVGDFDFETGELIDADIAQTGGRLFSSPPAFRGDVLVLQGRQDPLGESTALKLHAHYAGSKLAFVEKAGHYSWIERPVEVKETIVSFVRAARPSGR